MPRVGCFPSLMPMDFVGMQLRLYTASLMFYHSPLGVSFLYGYPCHLYPRKSRALNALEALMGPKPGSTAVLVPLSSGCAPV